MDGIAVDPATSTFTQEAIVMLHRNSKVILVAADGSAGSRRALEWALQEARLRGCTVDIVTAYQRGHRDSAEAKLRATTQDIDLGEAETVTSRVVEGEPVDVLVRESARSDLLVMGSHGVDGLIHSALGSVADYCGRMADCPVVILPPPRRSATHQVAFAPLGLVHPAGAR